MSENVKISNEDLINYWATFFDESSNIEEIHNMLEKVSNTNFERIIEENKNIDTKILDSFIWNEIKNESYLKETFEKIKDKNYWIYFYEPVLRKYVDEFIDIVKSSNIIFDVDSFLAQAISALLSQLNLVAYQTIIIELFYAKKSNLLKGNSKEERGKYFSDVLLKDDNFRKEVFSNYPELARVLDIKTKYGIEYIIKIINDTSKELKNIESSLNNNNKLGKIREIHMGEGDTHNNGKTVVKLVFDTDKIIIYKPHSLDIDKKYCDFIKWINNLSIINNSKENLLAAKVYTIEDAGWAQFIEFEECEKEEDLKNFYYRIGRVLCLLHTLNGNDMHFENLIAHKDMPVLIDLETLMHPDIHNSYSPQSAIEVALKEVRDSVTSTHLLPSKVINSKNDKVLEIGGLGAIEEQEAPFKGKVIENYGTDEVKVIKRHGKILPKNNNPVYKEKIVDSKNYKEEIICGFKNMYEWILKNKDMYKNKVESLFGNCEIRVLYRATNVYAQLLFGSFHPDLLTNFADRYIYLHRIAIDYQDKNHEVLNLEIKDMVQGDIPYFTIDVGGKQIHNINLRNINVSFKESTLEKISKKIDNMSEVKLFRQIAAINTSFMTEDHTGHIKTTVKYQIDSKRKYDKDNLINIAIEVADYMLERSIIGEKLGVVSRTWLGSEDLGLGFNMFTNVGGNIYTGLSGIALFYNYLWIVTKKYKYKEVVKEIITSLLETIPREESLKNSEKLKTGAFNGLGGIAYTLYYIDESNETDLYTNDILSVLDILECNVKNVGTQDIINNVGNLGIVISLYEKTKITSIKSKSLTICEKIYEKLDETKVRIDHKPGITWSEKGYVGYAHGNAGIIAQLYRWYSIIRNESVLKLIDEALLYERSMYSEKEGNWYRAADEQHFTCGWCHGAPGILLSKVQLKKLGHNDDKINEEIMIAINKILVDGLNNDISLCHGDMGNMVILKEAALHLNDKKLYDQTVATIEEILGFILELIKTEKFKGNEYNGFMIGLSGIAYEILRIGRENQIPNILGLE